MTALYLGYRNESENNACVIQRVQNSNRTAALIDTEHTLSERFFHAVWNDKSKKQDPPRDNQIHIRCIYTLLFDLMP